MNSKNWHTRIVPYTLQLRQPAGTSRGVYHTRKIWYILLTSPNDSIRIGIGECAPLPNLSCDDLPNYKHLLKDACRQLETTGTLNRETLRSYPSILFGLESALLHYNAGSLALWDTPFARGEIGIPINGLIWMGDYQHMFTQIQHKLETGFTCLKLKIGAINFDEELALLKYIRSHFSPNQIELRVDANGAFTPNSALEKLKYLSDYHLHSIEQPIRAGQWDEMARLTELSPLPIALDEELIGCNDPVQKTRLLQTIHPQYIILKPSLHGGLMGSEEWIQAARSEGVNWWITSALESNIGLNMIAHWCATLNTTLPQGLGTGSLYTNNISVPLYIDQDKLRFNPQEETPLCIG